MGLDATARRRWFGALVLVGALAMLAAGQTVLRGRLSPYGLLLYWLGCMALTLTAMVVALFDARAMQQRTRQQRRELLESTLQEIQAQARSRRQAPSKDKPQP